MHKIITTLTGIDTESIPEEFYNEVKAQVENTITSLQAYGFTREDIKIHCDDRARKIDFGYFPDELDALLMLTSPENNFIGSFTRKPFEQGQGWCGYRYRLTYKDNVQDCLRAINILCRKFDKLSATTDAESSPLKLPENTNDQRRKHQLIRSTLSSLFNNQDVTACFVTEIHHHKYPKQFLIKNLQFFKQELGIETLFLEFLPGRHQHLLDEYFKSKSDNLPPLLAAYLSLKDEISGCGFAGYTEIVKAAKQAGIRVVGLDCYESLLSFGELNKEVEAKARLKTFNYNAIKIIQKENHGKNFLAFTGLEHGYTKINSAFSRIKSISQLWKHSCVLHLSDAPVSLSNVGLFSKTYPLFSTQNGDLFESNGKEFGAHIVNVKSSL